VALLSLIGFLLYEMGRRLSAQNDIPRMHLAFGHIADVQPDRGCRAITGEHDGSGCLLLKKTNRSSDPNPLWKSNWPTLPRVRLMAFLLDELPFR